MSGSLRRLREQFDDELLVRVGRRLELTPLGAALVEPVHEVMLQIALALETQPSFDPARAERRFSIAMSDYATVTLLPRLITALATSAPGIVCEIRLIDDAVFRDIGSGKLDFCVLPNDWRLYQDHEPEGIRSLPLFEDDFVCVVSADNPVARDHMSIDDYLALPHNMVELGGGVKSIVESAWTSHGVQPRIAARTTSFASLVFMIPGTPLVATAQRRLAVKLAHSLPIRILECPLPIAGLHETLNWHQRNDRDPAHRFVREMFEHAARTME